MTNVYFRELEVGLAQLRAALDLAVRVGSVDEATRAQANIVDVLEHSGRLEVAGDEAMATFAYAQEHGLARGTGATALAEGALAIYRLGRWDRAGELLRRAWRQAPTGATQIMVEERLALLDAAQGRFEVAAGRLDIARPLVGRVVEAQFIAPLVEAAAELALWRGDPVAAGPRSPPPSSGLKRGHPIPRGSDRSSPWASAPRLTHPSWHGRIRNTGPWRRRGRSPASISRPCAACGRLPRPDGPTS